MKKFNSKSIRIGWDESNRIELFAYSIRFRSLLCTNYKQKYSLLNSNRCLCTNIPLEKAKDNLFASFRTTSSNNRTQECQANYFYTCGNTNNSNIYSVYVSKLQCLPGKRRKYENYFN
jgi:hypothetical protein